MSADQDLAGTPPASVPIALQFLTASYSMATVLSALPTRSPSATTSAVVLPAEPCRTACASAPARRANSSTPVACATTARSTKKSGTAGASVWPDFREPTASASCPAPLASSSSRTAVPLAPCSPSTTPLYGSASARKAST